jgi:hypothetical protein
MKVLHFVILSGIASNRADKAGPGNPEGAIYPSRIRACQRRKPQKIIEVRAIRAVVLADSLD